VSSIVAAVRGFPERRPLPADLALAVFVLGLGVVGAGPGDVVNAVPPGPVAYSMTVLGAAPLVLRRRFPVVVLLLVSAGLGGFFALGCKTSFGVLGPLLAIYSVAVRRSLRLSAGVSALAVALIVAGAVHGLSDLDAPGVVFGVTQAVIALAAGCVVRMRGEQNESLRHERDLEAERAVTAERLRIARELHDVVAHHLSVISVQANLATYVLDSDVETARGALGTIATTASGSLDELGRLLRVLRPGDDDREPEQAGRFRPQPGLADLPELVERVRAAGVSVDLVEKGEARPLTPGAELCAYRVAQEALTNVLKHAPAAEATVVVHHDPDELRLEVGNTSCTPPKSAPSTGHGLIGMCERARMYGGTVRSGPRADGGFQVDLRLPRSGGEH